MDLRWVPVEDLLPNPWNPNRMDEEMFGKAVASIREFGFIDPITVRHADPLFEIIDGEHRWMAAKQEGMEQVPIIDLGIIDDAIAQQLTIVLNETRGQVDPTKLGRLLADLASKVDKVKLLTVLPYGREAFDRLAQMPTLDFNNLTVPKSMNTGGWVERVYRMPKESAEVIDAAFARWHEAEGDTPEWKILELLAADYLGA